MIAVDTNILVYSHRPAMPLHQQAAMEIEKLMSQFTPWAIPWPCVHEFISIITNPRIFKSPTPITIALEAIEAWTQAGNLFFLSEGEGYLNSLKEITIPTKLTGAKIHNARIAAICKHHGIRELWTCDRDFSLFPDLMIKNPLVKTSNKDS